MRSRRTAPTAAAVTRQPGQLATVLIFMLALLTGAGAPFPGRFADPYSVFPTPGDLIAAARRSGYLGMVVQRPGSFSPGQVRQALLRRDKLPADQRTRLDDLLAAAEPATQDYLAEAFAAGHAVTEVAEFAAVIAGHSPLWLRSRLRPVDPGRTGPVEFGGNSISQYDDTTCGPAIILAARALIDPVYALHLTTGGWPDTTEESGDRFEERLRTEERRIHDESDLLWPQRAGTSPWGISRLLNTGPADLAARYRWTAVAATFPSHIDSVIRRALAAVDRGYPVPLLIGDLIPRHYVLLLRHDARGASFYESTAGEVVVVPAGDLRRRDFSAVGYARLHGAVLPSGPAAR
jgi:hypothetical protein